jgi:protein required for attachment to host cells
MSICVLVADSSKARFFSAPDGHSDLQQDRDMSHSDSRLKEQDLVANGVGSASDAGGYGKHLMGHENAAHQRQAEMFANELSSELDKTRQSNGLLRIYLIAAPRFLGLLRESLSSQCTALLTSEINKDLVNHNIKDIRSHLPTHL